MDIYDAVVEAIIDDAISRIGGYHTRRVDEWGAIYLGISGSLCGYNSLDYANARTIGQLSNDHWYLREKWGHYGSNFLVVDYDVLDDLSEDDWEFLSDLVDSFDNYPVLCEQTVSDVEYEWFSDTVQPILNELAPLNTDEKMEALLDRIHRDNSIWVAHEGWLDDAAFWEAVDELEMTRPE